ncbi:hypothetical protein FHX06_002381 [Rhizobium sp. BK512]|jgi:hypothetical protein|nr:hypothetical protein [Rhizobium sp. BK512]
MRLVVIAARAFSPVSAGRVDRQSETVTSIQRPVPWLP